MAAVGSGGGAAAASAGGGGGAAAATLAAGDGLVAHLLAPTGDFRTAPNAIRLTWLAQVATQLADLHDTGGVHGDVRPARLRLLLLADERFPVVKLDPPPATTTPADATQVPYMHPGLLDGRIPAPTRDTDVYALGVTAWHMLSGTPPFAAAFPGGVATYDEPIAKVLLAEYLARLPDGHALPLSPILWHEHAATGLHRLWSARDRSGVTARSLAASLVWLATCAGRADGCRSIGGEPGHAISLIVAVQDTAMARVRSCVVEVEPGYSILMVKREVERVTGYLVEEQRLSQTGGAELADSASVASTGLRHADAVTVTVGGKYGIIVVVHRQEGMADEGIEQEVAGGDTVNSAVLAPIAARYDLGASAYLEKQHGSMVRNPATTTVRQHAIRPGSRIIVVCPPVREAPITISFVDLGGCSLLFKVLPTTKMEKILQTYASKRGLSPSSICLIFRDDRVPDDSTAGGIGLQDGGVVHVMLEQMGD